MLSVKVRRRAVVASVDRPLREALTATRLLVVDLDRAAEAVLLVNATASGRMEITRSCAPPPGPVGDMEPP